MDKVTTKNNPIYNYQKLIAQKTLEEKTTLVERLAKHTTNLIRLIDRKK